MGCFWGCGNNCRCNCNGNNNCNDDDDDANCAEKVRRAYWAGFRAGCNDPRCHRRHDEDNDCK